MILAKVENWHHLVTISLAGIVMAVSFEARALEDDLKKAVEIAAHGSKFQSERMKIAAENLANIDSTSAAPGGDAYRRKVIFAQNKYNRGLKTNVITTKKVDTDRSEFILKYDPTHPAADEEGYVKYPNVNRLVEKADASEAVRGYEADLSIIEMSNALIGKTIEAIK